MAQSPSMQPLKIRNQLAPTPERPPRYGVSVQLKNGTEITVADPTATRALVSLMDMQAVLGGAASHFGGPSAFAELMSATFGLMFSESQRARRPWHELFHFVNDAGHCENGLYALKANYGFADLSLAKLKEFRSITSFLTGHGESHLWPEGVYLSNGPLGSSLPQAQGLAFADKLRGSERVTIAAISDGASMEGEAREAFAAIPGLASKDRMAPFVMIISDNNTKLSGRIEEQSFSMEPTFAALAPMGWKVLKLENGHDLQACLNTIEEAIAMARANPRMPVAIHAKTIKGFGTEKTAQSSSGAHGFPLKGGQEIRAFVAELYKGETIPAEFLSWIEELEAWTPPRTKTRQSAWSTGQKSEKVQSGVARALISRRAQGFPIVSVTSDLPGSTGVADFHKAHPECVIDIGVAESNMVSMAAGLSKEGFIPIVDTFAQFGVTKGALPLIMASLSEAPVIAIFSHIGFQDAADGASHQALSYIAMTSAIPHCDTYCLSTSSEAEALVGQALDEFREKRLKGEVPRTKIFFLGRENFPPSFVGADYNYRLGEAQVLWDNSDEHSSSVTIVTAGALIEQALIAAEDLAKDDIGTIVINASSLNHPDVKTILDAMKRTTGRLLSVEDHQLTGGMGALIAHAVKASGVRFDLETLGVKDQFGQSAYTALELYQKHGLDAAAIRAAVKKLV